jgi:hypothetical protein
LKNSAFALLLVAVLCRAIAAYSQAAPPDVVLQGKITGTQNKTWQELPFEVPVGIHRISVDFTYTGRENKTALDLGIADPQRFRGYSGGNKSHFTIGESDATPSYLPGAIMPGTWKLLISVPNIRAAENSKYRAEIRFNSKVEDEGFAQGPLETGLRWYRGDLHMHTAHSDGSCASQSGRRVPCPAFVTLQASAAHGLDFIAITDHNATSHYDEMRELQPYFDHLLLIPGREITTFWGHFNIFGTMQYIDYRAVTGGPRDINSIVRDVRATGGIASVNHAEAPSGEVCMGCRWEPPSPVDMSLFTGVEVINGGSRPLSSAAFWDRQIAAGLRLTGIGGSDSHNGAALPGEPGAVGWPTTAVEASELSVSAILDGIRRGRVFIDLTASRDKLLDIDAEDTSAPKSDTSHAQMGGSLDAPSGHSILFHVRVTACQACAIHLFLDGKESPALPGTAVNSSSESLPFRWASDGHRHWMRVEVRDTEGRLALVSNPVYINDTQR